MKLQFDAKGGWLGGHAVFYPKAGNPDNIGEAFQQTQVYLQPFVRKKVIIPRIDTNVARQPRAIYDESNRNLLRLTQLSRKFEIIPR